MAAYQSAAYCKRLEGPQVNSHLYQLQLHAELDGDKVTVECATVNEKKREERLTKLVQECPGPKSPAPEAWKIIVPPVSVVTGRPGDLVGVFGAKVHSNAGKPPMLRAVFVRTPDGAARTVRWLSDAARRQGVFDLHPLTPLAKELILGFGQAAGGEKRGGGAGGGGGSRSRSPPNRKFLEEAHRKQEQQKLDDTKIIDI